MPQGDVIVGGSVSANSTSQTAPAPNSTANFNASGVSGGSMQVTGTFVGTLVPEGSLTGASGDWQAAPIANLAGTAVTSITAPGFFTFNAETFVFFRLRSTAWTSGTAAVVFKASPGAGPSGGGGGGGGGASTIADGADVAEGATTDVKVTLDNAGTVSAKLRGLLYEFGDQADAAATTDAGTFSFVAFVKRLLSRLTTLLPQTASGLKVDNSAVTQPVSAASLPLPTGAAADATLGTTNTEIGGLTETAPATDTASSGLNGRLQRMAQRMTSLIALLPTALVSNRLDVNLGAAPATVSSNSTLQAGTNTAGNIGGLTKTVTATLTRPANTTTYTAGDEMTDTGGAIRTITGIAAGTGKSGIITHCLLSCSSNGATKPTLTVYVYDTTSTPQTDNAAFTPADAEQDTCIGSFPLSTANAGDATANTGNFTMDSGQIHIPFTTSGAADLYFRVQVTNGYTPGANSDTYRFRFKAQQDA